MAEMQIFFTAHPFLYLLVLEAVALLGMFVHFLKLDIKDNTAGGIRKYFIENFRYTLLAIITTMVAAVGTWYVDGNISTAFLAGYAFDSLLNKAGSKE